jgi:phenylalanine-4-hydroxylase
MAIGEKIESGYSGPADPLAFGLSYTAPEEKTHKIQYSDKDRSLHALYLEVRNLREQGLETDKLQTLWEEVKTNYPDDWLLPMEILELIKDSEELTILSSEVRDYLLVKSKTRHEFSNLIENGLKLIY